MIQWDEALSSVRLVLEAWLEVQARWGHLAPLFGPSGLSGQLPLEVGGGSGCLTRYCASHDASHISYLRHVFVT